jgi:hypothetical protein
MTKHLLARLTIPLIDEKRFGKGDSLVFQFWLPFQDEDALVATEGDMELRFWIDRQCLHHVTDIDFDNINRYANIFVGKMNVDVSGIDVSDQLADVIIKLATEHNWTPEHISSTYDRSTIEEYNAIGEKIYSAVVKQFNRLIAYVRAVKGQYWLQEYEPDPNIHSEFLKLRAKVKIGESDWLRLTAAGGARFTITMPTGERFIAQEDWHGIRNHLAGERKAPLVGQLLAAADGFRESGHRRAALTEAISALEIAVSQFAQRVNPESWSTLLAGRSSSAQFHNHVEHLGVTCTIGYLFPVIFSEEQVPSVILKTCQDAITERNVVIHRGQRDVDETKLREYLRAIRDLCERLRRFNLTDGD